MGVVDRSFDHPLKLEEHAALHFAGGIVQQGYQCGMLWGAALAAGAQAYQLLGPGPQAESQAILAAQRLVESFRARSRHKQINCLEIIEMSWKPSAQSDFAKKVLKFFLRGGPIGCFSMAARYAPAAFSDINTALSEKHSVATSGPVSCAAMLAQKMGASELHTVMAAGFAGGIGLSGGGCGALGAAIWITRMNSGKEVNENDPFNNPKAAAVIESFLKSSGYEFECSKIVGRKFENINDHASYLREGGCAKIIEALAAHR